MSEEVKPQPRIKFCYLKQMLGKRFVAPHVLCLARIEGDTEVKFGWSFCIPSRWESTFGKTLKESYYDPSVKRDLTDEEYNQIIEAADITPLDVTENLEEENDGALIVDDSEKSKVQKAAQERLEGIVYKKYTQRFQTKRLVKGDVFCKKIAREIAMRRLLDSPIVVKRTGGKYATELMLDELRMSADVPRQVADVAEITYQVNKMLDEERNHVFQQIEAEKEESSFSVLTEPLREMWRTDIGKATIICGGICIAWLAGLILCAMQ